MHNVHAVPLDITDKTAIAALPTHLPAELDPVVDNAGIIVSDPVEGLSIDDLTHQLDVNVVSQIAVIQAVQAASNGHLPRGARRAPTLSSRQTTFWVPAASSFQWSTDGRLATASKQAEFATRGPEFNAPQSRRRPSRVRLRSGNRKDDPRGRGEPRSPHRAPQS
nr:hypothetical protein [Rhodococcus erythropolis]